MKINVIIPKENCENCRGWGARPHTILVNSKPTNQWQICQCVKSQTQDSIIAIKHPDFGYCAYEVETGKEIKIRQPRKRK